MPDYGVTEKGFVLKRMDTILEEIHSDLTRGFGVDTRLSKTSFLQVLVMTFAGQIADLWETAQDSYYAKFPATATGVSLDNAVQYGGIKRIPRRKTCFPLHCTGTDGTRVGAGTAVATDTSPEIRLEAAEAFTITREDFNSALVRAAVVEDGAYTVSVDGRQYSFSNSGGGAREILEGLAAAVEDAEYEASYDEAGGTLLVAAKSDARSGRLALSDNLTTSSVTTIANFFTEDYGRVTLPKGIVTKLADNVDGFSKVENRLEPEYGRLQETDIELRQSYMARSALRSDTMIDSIVSELLNNVDGVESASGYENDTDATDERGLPPHSIELVVEGGEPEDVASAILRRKAGGIQTYGSVEVAVPGRYGESIPTRFNRPEYLYAWLKVTLHGDGSLVPADCAKLAAGSIMEYGSALVAGTSLLTQLLVDGIYHSVAGVTYVDIECAWSADKGKVPGDGEYAQGNVRATTRQKILLDESRIEVVFDADE